MGNPSGERNIDLALREAIADGDWGKAKEALAQGADPNASIKGDGFDYAPLAVACDAYSEEQTPQALALIGELLKAKAQVNGGAPVSGDTPLHRAARAGWPQAVEMLLAAGADPGAKNKEGDQPLHCASLRRSGRKISPKVVEALLGAGVDVDAKNALGLTPLHCACACAELEVAKSLIAAGANARAKAIDGRGFWEFARDALESHPERLKKMDQFSALSPARAREEKAPKPKQSKAWEVQRWIKDKTYSSHDHLRQDGDPVAKPGGQKEMAINPLSLLEIVAERELGKKIEQRVASSRSGIQSAQMEPGLAALALPWSSHRTEGGMWQETDIDEQNFAIVAPLRWTHDDGRVSCVLALANITYDVSKKVSRRSQNLPPPSEMDTFWSVLDSEKHLMSASSKDDRLGAVLREASRRWNASWLLNPGRLESEKLEATTAQAPSRGPAASL